MLRQGCVTIWFSIGLGLCGFFNIFYDMRGIVVTFYNHSSFYLLLTTGILSMIDMFVGMVPTRSTYIPVISLFCSVSPFVTGWGFPYYQLLTAAATIAVGSIIFALILHIILRIILLRMKNRQSRNQASQGRP